MDYSINNDSTVQLANHLAKSKIEFLPQFLQENRFQEEKN